MSHGTLSSQDGIAIATLERGKVNALDRALMADLREIADDAASSPEMRALVIASGRPGFFSAGFDVAEAFSLDRDGLHAFFGTFIDLYETLLWFPKPLVAALRGHAKAGGAVMALTADVRVMAEGDFGFAINEVNLGVVLPQNVKRLAIDVLGSRQAKALLLSGRTVAAPEAERIGLVEPLVEEQAVLATALGIASELGAKPAATFAATKRMLRELAGFRRDASDRRWLEPFLDHWFSDESKSARKALLASLGK